MKITRARRRALAVVVALLACSTARTIANSLVESRLDDARRQAVIGRSGPAIGQIVAKREVQATAMRHPALAVAAFLPDAPATDVAERASHRSLQYIAVSQSPFQSKPPPVRL